MPVKMNEYCRGDRDNLVPIKLTVYKAIEAPQSVSHSQFLIPKYINNVINVLIIESVGISRGGTIWYAASMTTFKNYSNVVVVVTKK